MSPTKRKTNTPTCLLSSRGMYDSDVASYIVETVVRTISILKSLPSPFFSSLPLSTPSSAPCQAPQSEVCCRPQIPPLAPFPFSSAQRSNPFSRSFQASGLLRVVPAVLSLIPRSTRHCSFGFQRCLRCFSRLIVVLIRQPHQTEKALNDLDAALQRSQELQAKGGELTTFPPSSLLHVPRHQQFFRPIGYRDPPPWLHLIVDDVREPALISGNPLAWPFLLALLQATPRPRSSWRLIGSWLRLPSGR